MARIFETGWETGQSIGDVAAGGAGGGVSSSVTRGPWSAYAHSLNGGGDQALLDTPVSEFYVGIGAYRQGVFGHFIEFRNMNNLVAFEFTWESGLFLARLGRDGTALCTTTTVIGTNTWCYMEAHVVIHDTTGSVEIKVNGNVEATFSGDTRYDSGANGDKMRDIIFGESNTIAYLDDCYVNDTTGTVNNGYSGDIAIVGRVPNAAGDLTGLSRGGSDSGTNWGQVDERPSNDATDYVYGSNQNDEDLYNFPVVSDVLSSVQSVTERIRAQKAGSQSQSVAIMAKYDSNADNTADVDSQGADQALSNSWVGLHRTMSQQPDATNWNTQKVDALQVGVKDR